MVFHGTVKNGVVVFEGDIKPIDGIRVCVTEEVAPPSNELDSAHLRDTLLSFAGVVNSGRKDGSMNHDHYIYGIPKRDE